MFSQQLEPEYKEQWKKLEKMKKKMRECLPPTYLSFKSDDDLFQNLKIEIMKNEKMPHQF